MNDSIEGKIRLLTLNPSGVARGNTPVTLGVPFPSGALAAGPGVRLEDAEGNGIPVQARPLSRWPDGSIKWLLLDYQAEFKGGGAGVAGPGTHLGSGGIGLGVLSGYEQRPYYLRFGEGVEAAKSEPVVRLEEDGESVVVSNDRLRFVLSKERFKLFETLSLDGTPLLGPDDEGDVIVKDALGEEYRASRDPDFKVEVEENGGLRSVIKVSGKHLSPRGEPFLAYVLKYHVYAHAPWLRLQYQFINEQPPEEGVEVGEISVALSLDLKGETRRLLRHHSVGYNRTSRLVGIAEKVCIKVGQKRVELENPASVDSWDNYRWDVRTLDPLGCVEPWLDLSDDAAGVTTDIHEAMENFPKGIVSEANRLQWLLWPSWAGQLHLNQGTAKTHFLLLSFHQAFAQEEIEPLLRVARVPGYATIPLEWYQLCKVNGLERVVSYQPDKYPRLERQLSGMFAKWGPYPDPFRNAWPTGMLDYGDAVDEHYTATYAMAGFGLEEEVWNNNEYDFIHAAITQFCRSGDLRRLHDAQIASQHLMDVDFIHYSTNPDRAGGVPHHCARHTSGTIIPSHMFAEGLLEYYCVTGQPEALEVSVAIGENLLRTWNKWRWMMRTSCREGGWPLISLCALYAVTGQQRFLDAARRIVDQFIEVNGDSKGASFHPGGGFGTMVALLGVLRYYCLTGDEEVKRFFLEVVSWRTDNMLDVETDATFLFLEVLAFAYQLTGEEKYAAAGFRGVQRLMETSVGQPRTHKPIAFRYRGMATILKALDKVDHLKALDYVLF